MTKLKILLFSLLLLVLSFFACSTTTYAYTLTTDDKIVSSNLYYDNFTSKVNDVTFSASNSVITFSGSYPSSNTEDMYIDYNFFKNLETGKGYTLQIFGIDTDVFTYDCWLNGTHYSLSSSGIVYVNLTDALKNANWRFVIRPGATFTNAFGDTSFNVMISLGRTPRPYEPYGTWVNQKLYDKIEQENVILKNTIDDLSRKLGIYTEYVLYGWGTFIDSLFVTDVVSDNQTQLSKDDLISNGWLGNNSLDLPSIISSTMSNTGSRFRISITFSDDFDLTFWHFLAQAKLNLNMSVTVVSNKGKEYSFKSTYYPNDVNLGIDYDELKPSFGSDKIKSILITGDGVESFGSISTGNNDSVSFDSGYSNGYADGYENGSQTGYDNGFLAGKDVGYSEGIQQDFTTSGFSALFQAILTYPVNMIKSVFNFEFMGVNISGLILFIVSIGIVAFVLKKFR